MNMIEYEDLTLFTVNGEKRAKKRKRGNIIIIYAQAADETVGTRNPTSVLTVATQLLLLMRGRDAASLQPPCRERQVCRNIRGVNAISRKIHNIRRGIGF